MLDKFKKLPLRKGVGVILLNSENKVFVAKRIDNPKDFWQMPQGGVDEDEDFLKAAYRELEEETSIKNVKLIKDEGANIYDLFKYRNVIITSSSAKKIQERVLNEKN